MTIEEFVYFMVGMGIIALTSKIVFAGEDA
jgi:hypothetical protein